MRIYNDSAKYFVYQTFNFIVSFSYILAFLYHISFRWLSTLIISWVRKTRHSSTKSNHKKYTFYRNFNGKNLLIEYQ